MPTLKLGVDPGTVHHGYYFEADGAIRSGKVRTSKVLAYSEFAELLDNEIPELEKILVSIADEPPLTQVALCFIESPLVRSYSRSSPLLRRYTRFWNRWITTHCPLAKVTYVRTHRWQRWQLKEAGLPNYLTKGQTAEAADIYCRANYSTQHRLPLDHHIQDAFGIHDYGMLLTAAQNRC